jgi:phosphoenolpyruvate---glycerone phosphotransferase subunit DhaL
MGLTSEHLREAARRIAAKMQAASAELNAQDGKLGDGDLGITAAAGWAEIAKEADTMPDDVGQAFLSCAKAFQRASSSSFGTLMATAFMSAAKACKGRTDVPWSDISVLLAGARDAMIARGKGALGDKSMLDLLDAAAKVTDGITEPGALLSAVDATADRTLAEYRGMPAKLGRARMFGEKSVGLDDPGMLALRRMLDGLKG